MSKEELLDITAPYLTETVDYRALTTATNRYKQFFVSIVKTDFNESCDGEDLNFENGKALGTKWAAMCLDDIMRTKVFIKGIYEAIQDLLKIHDTVNICYAGTGPYATLLVPSLIRLDSSRLKCTFMEINERSLECVRKVLCHDAFNSGGFSFEKADLTRFQFNLEKPHLIISETMQCLLEKEQQVPIFINLMKQCPEETIFIPERITLQLALENDETYHVIKDLFELSKSNLVSFINKTKLQTEVLEIKDEQIKSDSKFSLLTDILVYKNHRLKVDESGLTVARPYLIQPKEEGKISIESHYNISDSPHLHLEIN